MQRPLIVLSHYQVKPILKARKAGERTAIISPDLNRTEVDVMLPDEGLIFPDLTQVFWEDVERIADSENVCFWVEDEAIHPIQTFSEVTGWPRSLFPTENAPTTLVSGLTMHRIKGVDPYQDTLNKIKAAAPITGRVLDTATGLGYTAIEAAKTAEHVITIELDPAALEIAQYNPWSQDLFNNPKIEQRIGDAWDIIEEMDDAQFSRIIHDPPMFNLAGDLYSGDFYRELYRVLNRKGVLFHYIGDPESRSGKQVTRGVIKRLKEAGFSSVIPKPKAFGVVATK